MNFPPKYVLTSQITDTLQRLDVLKAAYELVPVAPQVIQNIRRASLLKSSLFSARIEGNPLKVNDVTLTTLLHPESLKKREVANLLRALNHLHKDPPHTLTMDFLKRLHAATLRDISPEAGRFRTEVSAIFNEAGVAIYMTPPPSRIDILLTTWCNWCNTTSEPGPIKAALTHFWFEKIHPFLDGNGRVGRLVISWILIKTGYDFGGTISFEEYLDLYKQTYYDGLNNKPGNITGFVEFFLECVETQAKLVFEQIKNPPNPATSHLLPRRQEILDTIRDHQMISFDMIWRRFRAVPKSTLHNDLKQLMRDNFIKKLGATRGVVYTLA